MKIDRRLPFGFCGDWGMLYKRYTADEEIVVDGHTAITYANDNYVEIGMDVQFKKVMDEAKTKEQNMQGSMENGEYTTAETTDAYFDDEIGEYMCVVAPDDIVKAFGRHWIVLSIRTVSRHTPAEQKFFYLELKRVKLDEVKTI